MNSHWWSHFNFFFRHYFHLESAQKLKYFSSFFFGMVIILLCQFLFTDFDNIDKHKFAAFQCNLALFLTFCLRMQKSFSDETEDEAIDQIFSQKIHLESWFAAKCLVEWIFLIPFVLGIYYFSFSIMNQSGQSSDFYNGLFVLILSTTSLVGLGLLLSLILIKQDRIGYLYALFFLPLSTPVLLANTYSLQGIFEGETFINLLNGWIGLLIIFTFAYTIVSFVLMGLFMDRNGDKPT